MSLIFVKFFLITAFLYLATAEIYPGKCPTAKNTPLKIGEKERFHVLAYLSTSNDSENLTPFDYIVSKDSIKQFGSDIFSKKEDKVSVYIIVAHCICKYKNTSDLSSYTLDAAYLRYEGYDGKIFGKIQTQYEEPCSSRELHKVEKRSIDFEVSAFAKGDTLTFHGCKEVNSTHVSRGLMVLQLDTKNFTNIEEVVKEIFNEMNLGNVSSLGEKLVVRDDENMNDDYLDRQCVTEEFYNKCYRKQTYRESKIGRIDRQVESEVQGNSKPQDGPQEIEILVVGGACFLLVCGFVLSCALFNK